MAEVRTVGRYVSAILVLVLFPFALVGGVLQVRIYNDAGREPPGQWVRDYHDALLPRVYAPESLTLCGCENGDVIIAGIQYYGSGYYWVMRVRADGGVAWVDANSPYTPAVWFYDIISVAPDRYLIVGERDTGYDDGRTWLLCIDGLGGEVWNRTYDNLGLQWGSSVGLACSNGGALIISSVNSNTTGQDLCALRIDPDGAALWNVTYPTPWPEEWVRDAASASDGSTLVIGYATDFSSYYCILRCLEPTGELRWNQTLGEGFSCVAVANGGDYMLTSPSSALGLDPQGREHWRFDLPQSESSADYSIVACDNGYFLLSSFRISRVGFSCAGFRGLSIDTSGLLRWSWTIQSPGISYMDHRMVASGDGFYILPYRSCLLMRIPDPPPLTESAAMLAQSSYTLVIVSTMVVTVLVSRHCAPSATRRRSDSNGDPWVLLKASFTLQGGLLLFWGVLVLFYGPVRPYYESYPGSVHAATALLFLLLSPVGIANGILGAVAFAGLQLGVFPLDRYWVLERQRRGQPKAPTILTCACVVFLIFLGFYSVVSPPYYLAMLPFANGAILVGFLPKYLLLRWGS